MRPLASAQLDSASLHATLRGWADQVWLQLLDRNGAIDGRLSDRGILQRFHPDMHGEYRLDLIAVGFLPSEEYEWYARSSGFRWSAGSLNKPALAVASQFKVAVPVGGDWLFRVRADIEDNLEAKRTFLRFSFTKWWPSGLLAFAEGSVDPEKSGSDIEFGAGWRDRSSRRSVIASFAVLDWWSDFIYLNLQAAVKSPRDSTIEYEAQPLAVRISVSWPLGSRARAEGFAGISRPSTVLSYEGLDRGAGFRQVERFGFAGALVEWTLTQWFRLGVLGHYLRARTTRTSLAADAGIEDWDLIEQTTAFGAFALAHLWGPLTAEASLVASWRPERRRWSSPLQTDVDFQDRAVSGQVLVRLARERGFIADVGVPFDIREVVRGAGQIDGAATARNYRIRADFGWRFNKQFAFLVGAAIEPDGDGTGRYFGGARARSTLHW